MIRSELSAAFEWGFEKGEKAEYDRINNLLNQDEVMHNVWWSIKREDTFPSQELIADIFRKFILREDYFDRY